MTQELVQKAASCLNNTKYALNALYGRMDWEVARAVIS